MWCWLAMWLSTLTVLPSLCYRYYALHHLPVSLQQCSGKCNVGQDLGSSGYIQWGRKDSGLWEVVVDGQTSKPGKGGMGQPYMLLFVSHHRLCKGSGLHHGHLVRYFSLCFISCKLYTHLCKVSTPLCKCPTLLCRYYTTCVTSTLNCVESTPFCVTSTHI